MSAMASDPMLLFEFLLGDLINLDMPCDSFSDMYSICIVADEVYRQDFEQSIAAHSDSKREHSSYTSSRIEMTFRMQRPL